MRVLVTGSREWRDGGVVWRVLTQLEPRPTKIIHGGCRGVDRYAETWARLEKIDSTAFLVDLYCARYVGMGRALVMRNQRMVDEGKPDLCLAFPGGNGTADTVARCRVAGVPVREVKP